MSRQAEQLQMLAQLAPLLQGGGGLGTLEQLARLAAQQQAVGLGERQFGLQERGADLAERQFAEQQNQNRFGQGLSVEEMALRQEAERRQGAGQQEAIRQFGVTQGVDQQKLGIEKERLGLAQNLAPLQAGVLMSQMGQMDVGTQKNRMLLEMIIKAMQGQQGQGGQNPMVRPEDMEALLNFNQFLPQQ